jgi:hypothetical protein
MNNPVFQRQLFTLQKTEQLGVLNTLRKISAMTWQQIYEDSGLQWEAIISRKVRDFTAFGLQRVFEVSPFGSLSGCVSCRCIQTMTQLIQDKPEVMMMGTFNKLQ